MLSPAVDNGTVFIAPQDGALQAINISNNHSINGWPLDNYSITSSPAIDNTNQVVYVGTRDKKVLAVNEDGTIKWTFEADGTVESSPAISADKSTIYVGSDDNKFYALNASNGNKLWSYSTDGDIVTPPALYTDNKTAYFSSNDGYLYALNTQDGSLKWKLYIGGNPTGPVIGQNGMIYVGSQNGNVYAVYPYGITKWTHSIGGWITSQPVIGYGGTLYVGADDWTLYALNPDTGNEEWHYKTNGQIKSSPLAASDGNIYVGSYDGYLYAIDNSTGLEKKSWELGGFISSSPVLYDNNIYIGSNSGYLYKISLDNTSTATLADSAWPMFKHDTQHTGYDNSTLISDNITIDNLTTIDGVVDGDAPFVVTLRCTASADNGSIKRFFWDFNGDGTTDSITYIPTENATYTASATYSYTEKGTYAAKCTAMDDKGQTGSKELNITVNQEQDNMTVTLKGHGTVTSSPAKILCDTGSSDNKTCTDKFDDGTDVYLTAAPYAGYQIFAWYGDCAECNNDSSPYSTCKVAMDGDKTCTIEFKTQAEIDNNTAPVATNIIVSGTVKVGNKITLTGSGSDTDGDSLNYKWSMVSQPEGSSATLTSASTNPTQFTPDKEGAYKIQLIVNDGRKDSEAISTTINVSGANRAPVAVISVDNSSIVVKDDNMTLSGAESMDPDGDTLSYAWKIYKPDGNLASLTLSSDNSTITFTPDQVGTYSAVLKVSDTSSLSDTATLDFNVTSDNNSAPTAVISRGDSAISSTTAALNSEVTLSGDKSSDPDQDILTYKWQIIAPDGSISSTAESASSSVTFTPTQEGDYTAILTVSDGKLSAAAKATITAAESPTAKITTDSNNAVVGTQFNLNASESTGPTDEGLLQYKWEFISKPAKSSAELTNNSGDNASTLSSNNEYVKFTPDVEGNYTIQLTVKTAHGSIWDTDNITISAHNAARQITIGSKNISKGQCVEVPINIDNSTDVSGFEFYVTYNPNVLELSCNDNVTTGSLTDGWYIDSYSSKAGEIHIMTTSNSLTHLNGSSGSLAKIKFKAIGDIWDNSTVAVDTTKINLITNEDAKPINFNVTPGVVKITASGDLNGDGTVNILDVMKALQIALGITTEGSENADMNDDGTVNILDVILILQKALS